MGLKEFFLWQLEHEVETSRKVIERVPEGRNSWKPHERSMELGYLAALVASMPGWVEFMINRRELDLSDPANDVMRTKPVRTRAELCHMLAMGLSKSRKALQDTTEDHLLGMWRFRMDGQVVSEGPRYAMIADGAITHLAHHRGQLTVYLRLLKASERRKALARKNVPQRCKYRERHSRSLHCFTGNERWVPHSSPVFWA
jgi:uncharacterized damage-inducible protein DinB